MINTIAVLAVCLLAILLLVLRFLLKRFFSSITHEEQEKYKGVLPYPLLPAEGNSDANRYAKQYHTVARLGLAIIVVLALIPVLKSMVEYLAR